MIDDLAAGTTSAKSAKATVDRRTAIKAALGGAAAAAVFTAPRIEGFSIAPDYAAAGTVCSSDPETKSTTITGTKDYGSCFSGPWRGAACFGPGATQYCNGATSHAACGNTPTVMPTLSIAKPGSGNVDLNLSTKGGPHNPNQGNWSNNSALNYAVTGMGGQVNACTVNITGDCGPFAFRISNANLAVNNNDGSNGWSGGYGTSHTQNFAANGNQGMRKMDCDGIRSQIGSSDWVNAIAPKLTVSFTCSCP